MRVLLLTAAVVLLAGCGDDDAAPTEPVRTTAVKMVGGNAFSPRAITVQAGATVVWTNDDDVPHNAVAADGEGPRSELFGNGGTYAWKAATPGTIEYVCTVHPGMDGTIEVE